MTYEYFAQGVELLRRHGSLTVMQLRQFEAYLGRGFVPTAIENQVKAAVGQLAGGSTRAASTETSQVAYGHDKGAAESSNPPIRNPKSEIRNSFWSGVFDDDGDAPAAIGELHRRAIALHKRESLVHAQMGVAARAGQRLKAYELAREIMEDIRPELDGIYDAVREWQKTGQLAVRQLAVANGEMNVIELMKRLKYCNERVCRIGKWLSDGYREKKRDGDKVKVLLTAKDVQALDNERLDMLLEAKQIKEKLGI